MKPPKESLVFGHTFTDHMFQMDYTGEKGWNNPTITPVEPLNLHPACSVFHYGLACFEGMKAYRSDQGQTLLFRPEKNVERLARSCERLSIPAFDQPEFLDYVKDLVRVDQDWIPQGDGYSLYIRPTVISTEPTLGVGSPNAAKAFVLLSPVGPYYPNGFQPVTLKAETQFSRAFPGGAGDHKVGGNYAPTILPQRLALEQGCDQILWLHDGFLTEAGTMNMFVLYKNGYLVTPPLDGTILPGITRKSILELGNELGVVPVEQKISMVDFLRDIEDGNISECFGAGTAAVVSPIDTIIHENEKIKVPTGDFYTKVWKTLTDIQYGRVESSWSVEL